MNQKPIVPLSLGLAAFICFSLFLFNSFFSPWMTPALAGDAPAPLAQFTYIATPTPGPDGRIVYIVQSGDSAWSIAARYGFVGEKYNELRAMNKWGDNPIINEGDEILLGFAGPAAVSPTVGPSPTSAPLVATATPLPGKGDLCIMVYNDENGDSLRQEEEVGIPGGAISIANRSGSVSQTGQSTTGLEPLCFKEIPEGTYNISVAIPDDYNATTSMNSSIQLMAGDTSILDFGAQESSKVAVAAPVIDDQEKSPILGILGGGLLVAGVVLGLFAGKLLGTKVKTAQK